MKGRRYFRLLLCASMTIFMVLAVLSQEVRAEEENVGYSAHTQQEAVNWANAQIGKSLDYDKAYGAQCVDLIKYYYDYFGVANYAMGNANAYITRSLPSGWTRVYGNYQPGDIAVWKVNHSCGTCSTGGFGHVGIITSADSVGFNAVNQNFNNKSYCTQNWFRVSALACGIRPNFSVSEANLSYEDVKTTFVDTWNAGLYGKINNPGRAVISNVGAHVWNSSGALVVDHQEYCGRSTSVVYQNLNIVGEARPQGLLPGTYTFQLWASVNGKTYYSIKGNFRIDGPVVLNGWTTENGNTYYYNNNVKLTGFRKIGDKIYYFKTGGNSTEKGKMLKGWQKIYKRYYYFQGNGSMISGGWRTIGKKSYYFNSSSRLPGKNNQYGSVKTGLKKIGKYYYYFNPKGGKGSNGQLLTGYQKFSQGKRYFKTNGKIGVKGRMLVGKQKIRGINHYFKTSGTNIGIMVY